MKVICGCTLRQKMAGKKTRKVKIKLVDVVAASSSYNNWTY